MNTISSLFGTKTVLAHAPRLMLSMGAVAAIFAGCAVLAAGPTIVYSDGGSHEISGSSTTKVELRNQTALSITSSGQLETNFTPVIRAIDEAQLSVSGRAVSNAGIDVDPVVLAENQATVEVNGGTLNMAGTGSFGTGPRAVVAIRHNASLNFVSGSIYDNGAATIDRAGVLAEDNSRVTMHNGLVQAEGSGSNFARYGILARGQALVSVLDGVIGAGGSGSDSDRFGIVAEDEANVSMFDGVIAVGGSGSQSDRIGILAADRAHVSIFGGELQLDGSGGDSNRIGIVVRGEAHVDILGGDIVNTSAFDSSDLLAEQSAQIRLVGHGFNLPYGYVQLLSGNITGILYDGTRINFSFQRDAGAAIILAVPEPGTVSLVLVGSFLALCVRPRKPEASGR